MREAGPAELACLLVNHGLEPAALQILVRMATPFWKEWISPCLA